VNSATGTSAPLTNRATPLQFRIPLLVLDRPGHLFVAKRDLQRSFGREHIHRQAAVPKCDTQAQRFLPF
jgi:hypothetical protein